MTIKRDELDQTDFSDIATGRSIPEFDPTPTTEAGRAALKVCIAGNPEPCIDPRCPCWM